MKNKYLVCWLLGCCIANASFSQNLLNGKVFNEFEKGLESATLRLYKAGNTSTPKLTISDSLGKYQFTHLEKDSAYTLIAFFLGKVSDTVYFKYKQDTTIDLHLIKSIYNVLDSITVTYKKPTLVNEVGKLVYYPNSELKLVSSAFDILKHTPLVFMSPTLISLIGKKETAIYINGKPSQMKMDVLINWLNSLPAKNIRQIELITNPSVKYEANITGGIINIVLRKNIDEGWNFNLYQSVEQYYYNRQSGYFRIKYAKNKFSFSLTPYYNHQVSHQSLTQNVQYANSLYTQSKTNTQTNPFNVGLETILNYFINPKQSLNFTNTFYNTNTKYPNRTSSSDYFHNSNSMIFDSSVYGIENSKNITNAFYGSINYENLLDDKGQSLTANLRYNLYNIKDDNGGYLYPSIANNLPNNAKFGYQSTVPQTILNFSAKVNYNKPLNETLQLETGLEYNQTNSKSDITWKNLNNNLWVTNPSVEDKFTINENIESGFLMFNENKFFTTKMQLSIGLRAEAIQYKGSSKNHPINDVNIKNLSIFPSFYWSYTPNDTNQISLSFSGKIIRPNYSLLNPSKVYENPNLYTVGNPFLLPTKVFTSQLMYVYKGAYYAVVDISFSKNTIAQFLLPNIEEANSFFGKQYNYGNAQSYALVVGMNKSFFNDRWALNTTLQAIYAQYASFKNFLIPFKQEGFSSIFTFDNTIYLAKKRNWISTISFSYNTPTKTDNAAIYHSLSSLNIGIKKIWNKFSLSLFINDIYNGSIQYARLLSNSYQAQNDVIMINDTRGIALRINYSFGNIKLKKSKNINTGVEEFKKRVK